MVNNNKIAGNTLLSLLFFMIVLALLTIPLASYYDNWKDQKKAGDTAIRLEAINNAIHQYAAANGHYPCPADIRADFDTADFGKSAAAECNTGTPDGFTGLTKRVSRTKAGIENYVRVGAVPVRTLGLPDDYIYDGYNHRYVYLVTEAYAAVAADGTPPNIPELDRNDGPGIFVEDINENTSTRKIGNAIYAVMSMGNTEEGSYSANGSLLADCPAGVVNCSLEATIQNTISRSDVEGEGRFTQTVRYDTPQPCIASETTPETVAFLLDNSTSMRGVVPPSRLPLTSDDVAPDPLWRIHPAQWALRRALIARNVAMSPENDPDGRTTTYVVGLIDPENMTYNFGHGPYSDSNQAHVEDVISRPELCPPHEITGTPLGNSLRHVADEIGGGRVDGPPNKIIALVDGGGDSAQLVDALRYIRDTYNRTLQVNFIDTTTNDNIPQAIEDAGVTSENATYVRTAQDPVALVYELLHRSNGCSVVSVPEPVNERYYCAPTCEESGTCPEPTCEELGTCPVEPTCEELGTCPEPTCEELGTCPEPTCEELGTCPPDPITFNGWAGFSIAGHAPSGISVSENAFRLEGYERAIGRIDYVGLARDATNIPVRSSGTTIEGNITDFHIAPDGDFTLNTNSDATGSEIFYYRGVITDPGPSNGIASAPFLLMGGRGAELTGNMYSLLPLVEQVMSRITMVEVNGIEYTIPDVGDLTVNGTNSRLTINQDGDFTARLTDGGGDYYYLKGPIFEDGDPLVIHDPVPLGIRNAYQWELNFRTRNGGRVITGQLRSNDRGVIIENVRWGGTDHPMTGNRLLINADFGTLNIRRDGYFSYSPKGGTGRDDFFVEGLER